MSVHPRVGRPAVLALAVPAAALLALLLAPGSLDEKLRYALSGLGAQRPAHSLVVAGRPLPMEARMLGIYAGFTVAVAVAWIGGGSRRVRLPQGWIAALLALGIGLMIADGFNAWIYGRGGPALYPPQTGLRLATGLLCGLAVAGAIAPVINFALWRDRDPRPLFATGAELARAAIALGVTGVLFWAGLGGATFLSVLTLLCVVAGFWLVNTYIAVGAWVGLARAAGWSDLSGLAIAGFALTVLELAGLAALRAWLERSVGVIFPT